MGEDGVKRFQGKVVLITGAASGIGLASARGFAKEGAKVVLVDRNGKAAETRAEEIRAAGGEASAFQADVTVFSECEAMVAHAVERFGGLHIAFNNAGVPSSIAPLEEFTIDEWDRVIATNLSAVFYAIKAEVPALRASGGAAIVNTASVASFVANNGMAAYVASKHGLAGLTKAAALDLIAYGIRVNAICPGVVDTPMLGELKDNPDAQAAILASAPIGRMGEPEEMARAAMFLASDESSYMVGTLMSVDGGVLLR